jgi:tetratricopeptide (TPR) repeat protein
MIAGGLPLNIAFAGDRLRELGLKQWWIADQLGVDRKTVARWFNGQVKRIQRDNLLKLARCLECESESLILRDETESLATKAEQSKAALLIQKESLIDTLGPPGQWRILESLIKATMQPDLPLPILGELYNQLSIAAWRQSEIRKGERYAIKAHEIGVRCRSNSIIATAKLNLATIKSFQGQLSRALELYAECLELSRFLEDDLTRGKATSNYGAVCLDAGNPSGAIEWQRRAIEIFKKIERPMNEAIAWLGLADALGEGGDLDQALSACQSAEELSRTANFRRGNADAALFKCEIYTKLGEISQALVEIDRARKQFSSLNIRESRLEEAAARLARLNERYDEAATLLAKAWKIAKGFPVSQTRLLKEKIELAKALEDTVEVARLTKERRKLMTATGADSNAE